MFIYALIAGIVMFPYTHLCKVCSHPYFKGQTLSRQEVARLIGSASSRSGMRYNMKEIEAAVQIAKKESNYKPTVKNKNSSAYGLYGFLNSTWKGTKVSKTDCQYCQTTAALRYIKGRYGTPSRALQFHRRNNYY